MFLAFLMAKGHTGLGVLAEQAIWFIAMAAVIATVARPALDRLWPGAT